MTTAADASPSDGPARQAGLWGQLALNYLSAVVAEGLYEQVLGLLGDPDVHAQVARFLEDERDHALGLAAHLRTVGPGLPDTLVGLFRDVARLVGLGSALQSTDTFIDRVRGFEQRGEQGYGELAERFPVDSVEAQRYTRYRDEEATHIEWLKAYRLEHGQEQGEAVEFSSLIAAPLAQVYAFYTDARNLSELYGVEATCTADMQRFVAGDRFHMRLGRGPLALEIDTHILATDAPYFFVERKAGTPFALWEHHHHFTPVGPYRTLVGDRLLVRPRGLPALPEALQPSPWKLALLAMLWQQHRCVRAAFSRQA